MEIKVPKHPEQPIKLLFNQEIEIITVIAAHREHVTGFGADMEAYEVSNADHEIAAYESPNRIKHKCRDLEHFAGVIGSFADQTANAAAALAEESPTPYDPHYSQKIQERYWLGGVASRLVRELAPYLPSRDNPLTSDEVERLAQQDINAAFSDLLDGER